MIIDKDNIKILLIILVLGLGIGYAYINSDLNINGTAQVNSANWDVHWANIQVTNGSVSASSPTISNQTTVNYSVVLNTPGDYYEFTVDAVNGGSIDAMIDTIDSKLNGATITTLPDYLSYIITYSDGVELEPNHILRVNSTETYKIKVMYRDDIELNQIPASNQALNLQFTVTYRQATDDAIEVDHRITTYTTTTPSYNDLVYIGQAIPSSITQYSTAAAAMASYSNNPFYLKHIVQTGVVKETYIEYVVSQEIASANPGMTVGTYVFRGAGATYNSSTSTYNQDSPYYENNKKTMLKAFGTSNCTVDSTHITCSTATQYAGTNLTGTLVVGSGTMCFVDSSGSSRCVQY